MHICCPRCEYCREVDEASLKPTLTLATCPECGHRFRFREPLPGHTVVQPPAAEENFAFSGEDAPARPDREDRTEDPDAAGRGDSSADSGQELHEPWAYMRSMGIVNAFVTSTRLILFKPQLFFSVMSREVSFLVPFSYYMLSSMLGILLEALWQTLLGNPILPAEFSASITTPEDMLQLFFMSPVIMTFYLYLLSAILHLGLMLTGVARAGSSTTLRVVCYSSAADLLAVVPVVGSLVGGLLRLWLLVVGLRTVYQTSTLRVLPSIGLLFLCLLVVVGAALKNLGVL